MKTEFLIHALKYAKIHLDELYQDKVFTHDEYRALYNHWSALNEAAKDADFNQRFGKPDKEDE